MKRMAGHGLVIEHNFDDAARAIELAIPRIEERFAREIFPAVALRVRGWLIEDYKKKAKLQRSPDGIRWRDVKRATLRNRLWRNRQEYREASPSENVKWWIRKSPIMTSASTRAV